MMSQYPNRNTLWAAVFVDELARSGLTAVCISPGSRSTPLTFAFAQHEAISVYSHLDERSAAFFALGHAAGTNQPVALVCTSGTAAANWYPAVIEAYQFEVPLLLLTADRPPELRHSGANQTIDQVKLYADYALWSVDMALPEAEPPAIVLRNLRTTANRAYAMANGLRKAPVHLNFPFRKPLEPIPAPGDAGHISPKAAARPAKIPFTQWHTGVPFASTEVVERLAALIERTEKGIIVCGPQSPGDPFPTTIASLAQQIGYPVFADPLSGVRFDARVASQVVSSYETTLANGLKPFGSADLVLRFGRVPTSKWLNTYLKTCDASEHIHIRANGVWSDDMHITSQYVQADEVQLCTTLIDQLPSRQKSAWQSRVMEIERSAQQQLASMMAQYFDGAIIRAVLEETSEHSVILAGNSLPIRHVDQFGIGLDKHLVVHANRGASGIDGNTSTALGLGAAYPAQPLVLLTGDITFYHDMNGLLAVNRLDIPITIVVINNNGGGIFQRLSIRDFEPEFTEQFLTPHGLTFSKAAELYGLRYEATENLVSFRKAFVESVSTRQSTIIEVFTDAHTDEATRRALVKTVQDQFKEKNK